MSNLIKFFNKNGENIDDKIVKKNIKINIKKSFHHSSLRLNNLLLTCRNSSNTQENSQKFISLKTLYKSEENIETELNTYLTTSDKIEFTNSSNLTPKTKNIQSIFEFYNTVKIIYSEIICK